MATLFRTAGLRVALSNRRVRLLMLMSVFGIVVTCNVACSDGLTVSSLVTDEGGESRPKAESTIAGTYHCYGHEKGLMAHAGVLYLHQDGTAGFNGVEGEWTYDQATKSIQFTGGFTFEEVEYDPDRHRLEVKLGMTLPHADQGVMSCEPMEQ